MESRSEKLRAILKVFLVTVSKRAPRWYRLRSKDADDKYSLSFLCGIPPSRFDDFLIECDFLRPHGSILRVQDQDLYFFLDASVVNAELVRSRLKRGVAKEFFVRIGDFGESDHFTANDQFASGSKPLPRPATAQASFRQSLRDASFQLLVDPPGAAPYAEQNTEGTTDQTTEGTINLPVEQPMDTTTEPTTEQTGEGTSTEQTIEGTTNLAVEQPLEEEPMDTTEPTTEQTTEGTTNTQRCVGWGGVRHRKVIQLSTTAMMRNAGDGACSSSTIDEDGACSSSNA
jgi:hypothetical protein